MPLRSAASASRNGSGPGQLLNIGDFREGREREKELNGDAAEAAPQAVPYVEYFEDDMFEAPKYWDEEDEV